MRIFPVATALVITTSFLFAAAEQSGTQPSNDVVLQAKDVVLQAMKDELQRAMSLSLQQLEKPYYGQVTIDDVHNYGATATLGGLLSARDDRARIPAVHIRVGDYKFDNTNWVGSDYSSGGRYATGEFPLDADYPTLRRFLWLAMDSNYKGSLQSIARKRAALRNVSVTDQVPDFAQAPKVLFLRDGAPSSFKPEPWVERTRQLSSVFSAYPALRYSAVEYNVIDGVHRFVNTEGSEVRTKYNIGSVQIRASAQAADGMIVRDAALFYTHDLGKMFTESELTSAAKETAYNVSKLSVAPVGENYSGPVLFEGVASAQVMAEILGANLHIARKPVPSPGQPAPVASTELEGRRGVRVMPEFFDVVDDPTLTTLARPHPLRSRRDRR